MKNKRRKKNYWQIIAMVSPTAIWLLLFVFVPMIYVIYISFCTKGLYGGVTGKLTLNNYKSIFSSLYMGVIWKSIVMAFQTSVICLVIAYPFAYALSKINRNIRGMLMLLLILPFWINGLIRLNGWSNILRDSGLVNTVLMEFGWISKPIEMMYTDGAVLFGMVYCFFPFMVLPLHTNISKLNPQIVEASYDLGVGKVKTFFRVIIPQTLPGIFAGTIQVFIPSLGAFFVADVMGGGSSVYLGNLIQNQFLVARNWPLGAVFSVLLIVFTLIVLKAYSKVGSLDDLA